MLEVVDLTWEAGRKRLVDRVTLALNEGEIGGLLGPSGSGKTSLLRLIMGLNPPSGGRVVVHDRVVAAQGINVPPERRGLSMVFQEFTLFPHLSAEENIRFGIDREKVDLAEIIDILEISHVRNRFIGNLSGGEQQRVALARSLASAPRVLLLDEPFSNIDYMLRERLYSRVLDYLRSKGITVVLATHDHDEAFFFSDKIFVMKDGRMIDSNTPAGIYQMPANIWVAEFFGVVNVLSDGDLALLGESVPPGYYLVRPEMLEVSAQGMDARLEQSTYFGFYRDAKVVLESGLNLRMRFYHGETPEIGRTLKVRLHSNTELFRFPTEQDMA